MYFHWKLQFCRIVIEGIKEKDWTGRKFLGWTKKIDENFSSDIKVCCFSSDMNFQCISLIWAKLGTASLQQIRIDRSKIRIRKFRESFLLEKISQQSIESP